MGRQGVRGYAGRGGQSEEEYVKQLGELLTPRWPAPPSSTWSGRPGDHRPDYLLTAAGLQKHQGASAA